MVILNRVMCWNGNLVKRMSDMTEEEAKALLQKLSEHYKEPVMPISKYCSALKTWVSCIEERNKDGSRGQGFEYHTHLRAILRDIRKSNLLYRILYRNDPFRIEKCPEHKGHWSGIQKCPHGCDSTGWLPNTVK